MCSVLAAALYYTIIIVIIVIIERPKWTRIIIYRRRRAVCRLCGRYTHTHSIHSILHAWYTSVTLISNTHTHTHKIAASMECVWDDWSYASSETRTCKIHACKTVLGRRHESKKVYYLIRHTSCYCHGMTGGNDERNAIWSVDLICLAMSKRKYKM